MSVALPRGVIYSYSLPETAESLTVEVTGAGAVDYCGPSAAGGFGDILGTIAPGESVELDTPGMLRSDAGSEVELTYADQTDIPEPAQDSP